MVPLIFSSILFFLAAAIYLWAFIKRRSSKKLKNFSLRLYRPDLAFSDQAKNEVKEIADERKEKELILESLGEGVISVDKEMRIKYINQLASRMLGLPKTRVIGHSLLLWEERAFQPLLKKAKQALSACLDRQCVVTDSLSIDEGKKSYFELIALPKAQERGVVLIVQDKSSQQKVFDVGKDFIANASHELRTPITIIKGFAETLQDMPDLSREMRLSIIEKIVRNCERMDNLVKSLLKLTDVENLPLGRLQKCDLIALAENCKHMLLSIYPTASVQIEKPKEPLMVLGDPDILELAVMNLLDNAVKYSSSPAEVRIYSAEEEKEVKLMIADKGIGIPSSSLEFIFDRFYTVSKTHSRKLGGAGLGLSIVKTIIEKHEGKMSVVSILGKGSTFTLSLPKAK